MTSTKDYILQPKDLSLTFSQNSKIQNIILFNPNYKDKITYDIKSKSTDYYSVSNPKGMIRPRKPITISFNVNFDITDYKQDVLQITIRDSKKELLQRKRISVYIQGFTKSNDNTNINNDKDNDIINNNDKDNLNNKDNNENFDNEINNSIKPSLPDNNNTNEDNTIDIEIPQQFGVGIEDFGPIICGCFLIRLFCSSNDLWTSTDTILACILGFCILVLQICYFRFKKKF